MSNPSLEDLLSQQLDNLNRLHALLEQETTSLVSRDVDAIETLLKDKLALLDSLSAIDKLIAQQPDVERLKQEPQLQSRTEEAKAKLQQCQQLNQHNQAQAELVSASLGRLKQLLQRNRQASTMTYTDEGQTHIGQSTGKSIKV